jgi:hypothetical protein
MMTPKPPSSKTFCKVPVPIVAGRIGNCLSTSMAIASTASTGDEDGSLELLLATGFQSADAEARTRLNWACIKEIRFRATCNN